MPCERHFLRELRRDNGSLEHLAAATYTHLLSALLASLETTSLEERVWIPDKSSISTCVASTLVLRASSISAAVTPEFSAISKVFDERLLMLRSQLVLRLRKVDEESDIEADYLIRVSAAGTPACA